MEEEWRTTTEPVCVSCAANQNWSLMYVGFLELTVKNSPSFLPLLYVSVQAGNHSSPGSSDRKVKESSGRVGSLHIICRHATVYIRIHEGPRRRKVQRGCPRGAS